MKTWFPKVRRFVPSSSGGGGGGGGAPGTWPQSEPEAQGMSSEILRSIKSTYLGDCVIVRNGFDVHRRGQPDRRRRWASCARSIVADVVWGTGITSGDIAGGLAVLDQLVADFHTPTWDTFKPGTLLCHPLSYTRPGEGWGYSKDWRKQDDGFQEIERHYRTMHDYFNQVVSPHLPGVSAYANDADGTPRFEASPLDAARWADLYMGGGR